MSPDQAFQHAMYEDKCPAEDTRKVACKDPGWAYEYALNIDKYPRADTRHCILKNVSKQKDLDSYELLYEYSLFVEKYWNHSIVCPHISDEYYRQSYYNLYHDSGWASIYKCTVLLDWLI